MISKIVILISLVSALSGLNAQAQLLPPQDIVLTYYSSGSSLSWTRLSSYGWTAIYVKKQTDVNYRYLKTIYGNAGKYNTLLGRGYTAAYIIECVGESIYTTAVCGDIYYATSNKPLLVYEGK